MEDALAFDRLAERMGDDTRSVTLAVVSRIQWS